MGNEPSRMSQKPEDLSPGLHPIWRKIEQVKRHRRKQKRASIVSTTELLYREDIESAESGSSAGAESGISSDQQPKGKALEKVPEEEEEEEEEEYCNELGKEKEINEVESTARINQQTDEPKDHLTALKEKENKLDQVLQVEEEEEPNVEKTDHVKEKRDHEIMLKKDDHQEVVTTTTTAAAAVVEDNEEQWGRKLQRREFDGPGSPSFRFYCNQTSDSVDNISLKNHESKASNKENLPQIMESQQNERSVIAESSLSCEEDEPNAVKKLEKGKKLRVLTKAPTVVSNFFKTRNWYCSIPFSAGDDQESPHLAIVFRKFT